jgi:hypothetical protein
LGPFSASGPLGGGGKSASASGPKVHTGTVEEWVEAFEKEGFRVIARAR